MKNWTFINTRNRMGLGTKELSLTKFDAAGAVLIICPASLRGYWREILVKVGLEPRAFVIISYQHAYLHSGGLGDAFRRQTVILDEPSTAGTGRKTRPAIEAIIKNAGHVIILDNLLSETNSLINHYHGQISSTQALETVFGWFLKRQYISFASRLVRTDDDSKKA